LPYYRLTLISESSQSLPQNNQFNKFYGRAYFAEYP
jgi:hypothetical protein